MIKTTAMILDELHGYANPSNRLARMVAKGDYIPIVRGLYETDPHVPSYLLAASIYGPSYISFEFALSHHDLIPEAVYTVTCASFEKNKRKVFRTPFGIFTYRDVPSKAFPVGLELKKEGDYYYRIATAEKALCDQLYILPPVANIQELTALLLDDLRIDEADLRDLDQDVIESYVGRYKSTNIKKLVSFLRRLSK